MPLAIQLYKQIIITSIFLGIIHTCKLRVILSLSYVTCHFPMIHPGRPNIVARHSGGRDLEHETQYILPFFLPHLNH